MATISPKHSALPSQPTPMWAVLTLTFLGSLGTGAVTNGFSFIASQGLGYGQRMNLLLALVLGGTYIVGALLSGRFTKILAQRSSRFTPRSLLICSLVLIAFACQLPILAQSLAPDLLEPALWVFMISFSPATGVFWPIVESYLSGGRSGKNLRSTIGKFNIIWSGALVISFWLMAPLLKHQPFMILSLLGMLQLLMCIILRWFPAQPPKHLEDEHEPHPPIYKSLLTLFRIFLIASYIVLAALSPLLPIIEDQLGVDVQWKTPIASAWLTSRVFLFFIFERWHGWHGRWWTPWVGMGLTLVGFASCLVSPMAPSSGLLILILGLVIMGIGIAITYYGALYYAMSVGNSDVDAGGKHEAVIGLGYTLGPLFGIISLGASNGDQDAFGFWLIGLITLTICVSALMGIVHIRRASSNDHS